jgi:seryl-tRNA synthetase
MFKRTANNQKRRIERLLKSQEKSKEYLKSLKSLEIENKSLSDMMLSESRRNESLCDYLSRMKKVNSSLRSFKTKIRDLLECPISLEMLKEPVFTPSGYTIEKSEMYKMIERNMTDPFTRRGV